ncbi:barstar family protein [Tellurirhabdus rosea]|uniref:barstar family protein n=1 Tax=Tellurirhabdus rosea TaxID=2674997 RepID=UPI002254C11C|nr:barstar family protein [Tellurirhabdus rosea]
MPNFVFIPSEAVLSQYAGFRIARIDGRQTPTLKAFYEAIAVALDFPDYFGYNLDSLDELLNDFDWLEDEKVVLYIANSDAFLAQEPKEEKIVDLLNILDATAEDWKYVDEEVEEISPMELVIALDPSPRMQDLFDREDFAYQVVS